VAGSSRRCRVADVLIINAHACGYHVKPITRNVAEEDPESKRAETEWKWLIVRAAVKYYLGSHTVVIEILQSGFDVVVTSCSQV
jgi:hypothetical protein